MVPLFLVGGLVFVLGLNASYWAFVVNQPFSGSSANSPSSFSSSSLNSGAVIPMEVTVSSVKQREGLLDLRSGVTVAMGAHSKEEKVISDNTAFNHSSTPPQSVQAVQTLQQSVRALFLILCFYDFALKVQILAFF